MVTAFGEYLRYLPMVTTFGEVPCMKKWLSLNQVYFQYLSWKWKELLFWETDGDSLRRWSVVLYSSFLFILMEICKTTFGVCFYSNSPLLPRAAMWSSKWRRCPAWCAWASALASWPSSTVRGCGWPSRGPPAPPIAAPSPAPSSPTASPSSQTARRRSPTCPPSPRFSPPTSWSPLASFFPPPPLLHLPPFRRRHRRIRRRR